MERRFDCVTDSHGADLSPSRRDGGGEGEHPASDALKPADEKPSPAYDVTGQKSRPWTSPTCARHFRTRRLRLLIAAAPLSLPGAAHVPHGVPARRRELLLVVAQALSALAAPCHRRTTSGLLRRLGASRRAELRSVGRACCGSADVWARAGGAIRRAAVNSRRVKWDHLFRFELHGALDTVPQLTDGLLAV